MTRKQAVTLCFLTIIVLVLGFMVSRKFWFRLDLTKNKAYTISQVSRNLFTEIDDQVQITFYLSDRLKAIHPLPGEIEDLLREYAAYSRGKIQITVTDPVKANLMETIGEIGIQAQQIQTMGQDQAGIITVYCGITIEYLDQIEVLPVVFSLTTLEYDLTSRIRYMIRGNVRQAGFLVTDNTGNWSEEYGYLYSAFSQAGYRLRLVYPGTEIPDTLSLLLVLNGTETLDETALYCIDQYIQTGGRVLFTAKGIKVDTGGTLQAVLVNDLGLLGMLSSYGVTVMPEIAMDRSALTMQYQTRASNGSVYIRLVRNPQWIRVLPENGNREHPICAGFGGLDLYWASPLVLNPPESVEAVPLFTSTSEAWSMREDFHTNPEIPSLFEKDAAQTTGRKILGVCLSGIFPSWFRGRPKPISEFPIQALPDLPDIPKSARVIVIGETEFITSFLGVTGAQYNLDFLIQAADWLGNDDDITGIRSRLSQTGRLDLIIDPEKRAAAMGYSRFVNIILTPLFVILAGIVLAFYRKKKCSITQEKQDEI